VFFFFFPDSVFSQKEGFMEAKLTSVAKVVLEMFGETPIDIFREIECDVDRLWFRMQNLAFNHSKATADFTKGLEVSPYFVESNPGYWGTYLN
jgi:hypothetical protein